MAADKVNLTNLNAAMTRFQQSKPVQDQDKATGHAPTRSSAQPVQDRFEKSAAAESFTYLQETLDAGRQAVALEPDVRQERIDEIRQKMADGKVITPEVKEQVSQSLERVMKLLDMFVS